MAKIFDYLQYLVVPFFLATVYFIFSASFMRGENYLEDIGTGVLCMGIAFAFASMGDMTKISKKEEQILKSQKRYRNYVKFFLSLGTIAFITSLLFVSMKWFGVNEKANQYYSLGLNLFPNVIAIFFNLKQMQDKKQYYDLKCEGVQ
jgi:uncharacterized membrane protein